MVTAGSAAAQLGGGTGPAFSAAGLLLVGRGARRRRRHIPAGRTGAAPARRRSPSPIYACGLAGILLLAAAAVARSAGGPPILRTPTPTQLAALAYLTIAVTALVFLAWYAAMERLGVDRTGLFNGLIPVASLAAVALTGTGTITPLRMPRSPRRPRRRDPRPRPYPAGSRRHRKPGRSAPTAQRRNDTHLPAM